MGLTSVEDAIKEQVKHLKNAHFMLVDGMSKLLTGKATNCVSSDIYVGGLKWNMLIFPEEDYITFGLEISDSKCVGPNWKVTCTFDLSIVSQTGQPDICHTMVCHFDENRRTWGEQKLISLEELKERFIVNDKAVFCGEITGVKPKNLNVCSIPRTMGTAERTRLMEVPRNNSKFTWKITQFSSFDDYKLHSSYVFTAGPRKWYLQMCPKGILEGKGNSLSLLLHASDYVTSGPKRKTFASYKLRVYDLLNHKHHEIEGSSWFDYDSNGGAEKFLPLEELHKASRGFLKNDEIYLGVEFVSIHTSENL